MSRMIKSGFRILLTVGTSLLLTGCFLMSKDVSYINLGGGMFNKVGAVVVNTVDGQGPPQSWGGMMQLPPGHHTLSISPAQGYSEKPIFKEIDVEGGGLYELVVKTSNMRAVGSWGGSVTYQGQWWVEFSKIHQY